MADWDAPALTDAYATFLSSVKARDTDVGTMVKTGTNLPTGFIAWENTLMKFQRWSGAAWVDLVLSVAGGGTAQVASALGTMAFQNASAVAITGGTISNPTTLLLSCHVTFASDGSYNIGTPSTRVGSVHIKTGLMIPVGTNMWVT
jgi:hypothetical protein